MRHALPDGGVKVSASGVDDAEVYVTGRHADLGVGPVMSDRGCPLVTLLNGPLMARRVDDYNLRL
ncbi:hypothetical protein GCM10009530_02600 [Microbispora corallina]|uniref:Uncharacterized protein n=1 Tax=Microbispora corallina TaxID=83302 RepID=A0ABQ4FRS0_9ACTN|nr:hypothetical protein Mco01_05130 [Microbispora corallina]